MGLKSGGAIQSPWNSALIVDTCGCDGFPICGLGAANRQVAGRGRGPTVSTLGVC